MNSTNIQHEQVPQEPKTATDLAICPTEISALDPNASVLWVQFLRRTGLPMSAKSKKGKNAAKDLWVDNNCRRAAIIRGFGVPSLIQRLSAAKDERARARVWWREAAACAEGETIPDLASENMSLLNPFILTKELKFENPRLERMVKTWADEAEASNTAVTRRVKSLVRRVATPAMLDSLAKARAARNQARDKVAA